MYTKVITEDEFGRRLVIWEEEEEDECNFTVERGNAKRKQEIEEGIDKND